MSTGRRYTDLFLEHGQRVCDSFDPFHRQRETAMFRDDGGLLPRNSLWFVGQDVLKRGAEVERLGIVLGRCRSRRRCISYGVDIRVR